MLNKDILILDYKSIVVDMLGLKNVPWMVLTKKIVKIQTNRMITSFKYYLKNKVNVKMDILTFWQ